MVTLKASGKINISPNLQAFLLEMRRAKYDRWTWIDQICIAQEKNDGDPKEFARQAPLMFELYTLAKSVIAWLGKFNTGAIDVLSKLPMLTSRFEAEVKEGRSFQDLVVGDRIEFNRLKLPERYDHFWLQVSNILNNAWFGRFWTLQEIIIPKAGKFMLGSTSIAFDKFLEFELVARIYGIISWLYFRNYIADQKRPDTDSLKHIRFCQSGWEHFKEGGRQLPLSMMLQAARERTAGKRRDMVYGMLALMAPHCRKEIKLPREDSPDKPSVRDLYADLAELFIRENEHPEECILNHVSQIGDSASELMSLPSWCPDLSAMPATEPLVNAGLLHGPAKQLLDDKFQGFNAGFDLEDKHWRPEKKKWTKSAFKAPALSSSRKEIYKSDGSKQLQVTPEKELRAHGVEIDRVKEVITYSDGAEGQVLLTQKNLRPLLEWERKCLKLAQQALGLGTQSISELYCRTLIANILSKEQPTNPRKMKHYTAVDVNDQIPTYSTYAKAMKALNDFLRLEKTNKSISESGVATDIKESQIYLGRMLACARGRCFFATQNGRLGLGPYNMKEGDRLCVFFHCPTPYTIRPARSGKWTFVGEAYVHNLMHGQATRMIKKKEAVETSWLLV